jgi:hypothetical protein
MMCTDEIIVSILNKAKTEGNELLSHFKIGYPSKQIAQANNSIFVAMVDSETLDDGFDHSRYTDLVEVLIITKNKDYLKAKKIIKTMIREIRSLCLQNRELFDNRPVFRNMTPEYDKDFVLTRGHLMIQVKTAPILDDFEEDKRKVCQILIDDMEVDLE